ncbi:MAG: DUF3667 domain-containing protein [bacterium]|nr:DUF3667 domain-containing protein [bacterium]
MDTSSHTKGKDCANCGEALSGEFCSHCGQRDSDLNRPFRELVIEWLTSFFAFDTRLLRTLQPLLFQPGFLTLEYIAGRRVRYTNPLKLYFAISIVLFIALSFTNQGVVRVQDEDASIPIIAIDTTDSRDDSVTADIEDDAAAPSWISKALEPLIEQYEEDPDRLNQLFIDRLAQAVFILVPLFALALRVLYRRQRYIAHLIYSLHLHSFAFLVLLLAAGVSAFGLVWQQRATGVAQIFIVVHTWFGLRRLHRQGRVKTALKMLCLFVAYLPLLIVTMILALAWTVVTF